MGRAWILAALLGGCAMFHRIPPTPVTFDGYPLKRFYRINEDLYSGAQPDPRQMAELVERYHIRTVIKLSPRWQGKTVVPPGVVLLERPIGAIFTPSDAALDQILDEIDRSPKPVFIHCRLGSDRTGLIVALYQLRHGVPLAQVRADVIAHGYRPYRGITRVWRLRTASLH